MPKLKKGTPLAIEHVKPGSLKPAPYNPRSMDDEARRRLERSLTEFGMVDPIIARRADRLVIGGHQRLSAAAALGLETVPVVFLDDVSDQKAAALNVALNNANSQGTWDYAKLSALLSELDANGFDATLTGFDEDELRRLLAPDSGILGDVDVDDAPEPPDDPITTPGDRIVLGRHTLICGDATSSEAWDRLLAGRRIGSVWTDPPYGVAYVGKTKEALTIQNDAGSIDQLRDLLRDSLSLAWAHCRDGASWYVAAPHGPQFLAFAQVLAELKVWRQTLVWVKHTFALGRSDYHYRHEAIFEGEKDLEEVDASHPLAVKVRSENEPIIYGWRPGAAHDWQGGRKQSTVLEYKKPTASRVHPTMKPVALIKQCLENSSNPGDTVADPFGGSGSTLIAAEACGRSASLMEIDPAYCDVIVTRWENATGQKALRP